VINFRPCVADDREGINRSISETHKGIETCSTVPRSELLKANLHILSTIFGHLKLNSKWPLCYKTNLLWNIANFIEILEEALSFYDYDELCNYPLSLLEQKKDVLFEKNISKEKVNILQHGTKEMYGGYTFQVSYEFLSISLGQGRVNC